MGVPAGLAAAVEALRANGWMVYVDVDVAALEPGGRPYAEPFEHDLIAFAPDLRVAAVCHVPPVREGRLTGAAVDAFAWHESSGGMTQELQNPRHRAEHKRRVAAGALRLPISRVRPFAAVPDEVETSGLGPSGASDVPLVALGDLARVLDAIEHPGSLDADAVAQARGRLTRAGASARDDDAEIRRFLAKRGFATAGRTLATGNGERVIESSKDGTRFAIWISRAGDGVQAAGVIRGVAALRRLLDAPQPGRSVPLLSGEYLAVPVPLPAGPSLAERLQRDGPLAPREAMTVGIELARHLEKLHAARVAHQNLRPAHVFAGPPMEVTSLVHCRLDEASGATGDLVRDMGLDDPYLAPEVRSLEQDRNGYLADLWGWGCVVTAALTGDPTAPADGPWAAELPAPWRAALGGTRRHDPGERVPRSPAELLETLGNA